MNGGIIELDVHSMTVYQALRRSFASMAVRA